MNGTKIEIGSILSHRTKRGVVELVVGEAKVQLEVDKARWVHGALGGAIEAAILDELIYRFLVEKVGLDDAHASRCLLDFREMRQGSRAAVFER